MKIAIIGAEGSGKTTLVNRLAPLFNAAIVEEYARNYLQSKGGPYVQADLTHIAQQQFALEQDAQAPLMLCDTDLHNIKIWSEIKYHSCDLAILNLCTKAQYDYYILTAVHDDWQQDGLREYASKAERLWLQRYYLADLVARNCKFAVLNGNEEERLRQAKAIVDSLKS
ncbi:MAG: hypothetical protein RL660_1959 [Bacteroidota bacterium]|jgi:nicotinamide riboside kinase